MPEEQNESKEKMRLVVDTTPEYVQLFDRLKRRTGAGTRSECFRNMLRFVAATLDEGEGSSLLLRDSSGKVRSGDYLLKILGVFQHRS